MTMIKLDQSLGLGLEHGDGIHRLKNCLKIPNGKSESVNRRRVDITMAKRERTKGQTMIYTTLHRKLKIK